MAASNLYDIVPADYTVSRDAVIKLEVNTKIGNKHPDVTGFICVTRDWLERAEKMLSDAEVTGVNVAFARIALWDSTGQYHLTGRISCDLNRYDRPSPPVQNPTPSDWY